MRTARLLPLQCQVQSRGIPYTYCILSCSLYFMTGRLLPTNSCVLCELSLEIEKSQEALVIKYFADDLSAVVLQERSLKVHTLYLEYSGSGPTVVHPVHRGLIKGSGCKQMTPKLENKAFSAKSTQYISLKHHKEPYNTLFEIYWGEPERAPHKWYNIA